MFMMRPMCIFCTRKKSDLYLRVKALSVCEDCYKKLMFTAEKSSFQPLGDKSEFSYLISSFYYDGDIRDAILRYKFQKDFAYAEIFAELMKNTLDKDYLSNRFDAIIPVPLSKERMNERGYNQSALIAQRIAVYLRIEYDDKSLQRVVNTKRQSGLEKAKRAENVRGAFSASGVLNKRIIVFDDIYTTGCTMNECAATLKEAGADEVIGLTLSISPRALITQDDYIESPF